MVSKARRTVGLSPGQSRFSDILSLCISIIGFFLAIQLLSKAFEGLSGNVANSLELAFSNPSVGLFIGLIGTAILQSSSTTTSMAVAAVAAGSITLENAIPVILGANIGTTLTSTIVAMSYVNKRDEFQRALSAGSIHDVFNILTCLIIFPLEIKFGILGKISSGFVSLLDFNLSDSKSGSPIFFSQWTENLGDFLVAKLGSLLVLILAMTLLFSAVKIISRVIYNRLIGQAHEKFESSIFNSYNKSFGLGFLFTAAIQSSSLTTCLIVPLVATNKLSLNKAFAFIVGANLGTTITAMIAALSKNEAAMSLAIAHFLFNSFGMIIFFTLPWVRKTPALIAQTLSEISTKYKIVAFAYILILFFIAPFILIYFSK